MRRAFFEWCTIAATGLSFLIAVCWAISCRGYDLDSHLKWGRVEYSVEGGAFRAETDPDFDEIWSAFLRGRRFRVNWIVSHVGGSVPGLNFRWCRWSSGRDDWSVKVSLAIPLVVTAMVGGYCGVRYRNK